jgi:hypothetical protein
LSSRANVALVAAGVPVPPGSVVSLEVLERLVGAEVGRERERADYLGGTDRLLAGVPRCCDRSRILCRHFSVLRRERGLVTAFV